MKFIIVIPLIYLLISCNGKNPNCPVGSHKYLTIKNESSKRICYQFYWNFPDSTIGEYNPLNNNLILQFGDSFRRTASPNGSGSCWEDIFLTVGKENIYFFDADIIEKLPWEEVRQNQTGLLERRVIDLEYCQKNNWQIIYK